MSMKYNSISENTLDSKIMIRDANKFWIFNFEAKFEKYVFLNTSSGLITYSISGTKIDNLCLCKVLNIKQMH